MAQTKTYKYNQTEGFLELENYSTLTADEVILVQIYNYNGTLLYESPNWAAPISVPTGGFFTSVSATLKIGTGGFGILPVNPATGLFYAGPYTFNYRTYDKTSPMPKPYVDLQEKILFEYGRVTQDVTLVKNCSLKTLVLADATNYSQTLPNTQVSDPAVTYDSTIENIDTHVEFRASSPIMTITEPDAGTYQGETNPSLYYYFISTLGGFYDYYVRDKYFTKTGEVQYRCSCEEAYCKAITKAECLWKSYKAQSNLQKAQLIYDQWLKATAIAAMIAGDCACEKGNYADYLAELGDCCSDCG